MSAKLIRYWHTIRHLKPIQIYGRLWFNIYRPRPDLSPAPPIRNSSGNWITPAPKNTSMLSPSRFRFLNAEHEIRKHSDWNNPAWAKLWLYNLHYFDDLNAQDAGRRKKWHNALLARWVEENPPSKDIGWEPYPISLRIVNWIKWFLTENTLSERYLHSLAVQARCLYKRPEYHLLGNHLFANAKALVFAGLFFKGPEPAKWLHKGLRLLARETSEQILEDGGHFERSPMYHSIILEDLLDLINIARIFDDAFLERYRRLLQQWVDTSGKMMTWLKTMTHPDGNIVLFNDAAFNITPTPKDLTNYAERLAIELCTGPSKGRTHLKETGYVRIENGEAIAFLDVGAVGAYYLPGHAHADTLTFELSLSGQRVIVDSGTSIYDIGKERLRQRGTAAHNTVIIGGENSSEVWNSFRVAHRAKPFGLQITEKGGPISVVCAHNGYKRMSGKPTHQRSWHFSENRMKVADTVSGELRDACGRFHFHPDIKVKPSTTNDSGELVLNNGRAIRWQILKGMGSLIPSTYHPEFGISLDNKCLEVRFDDSQIEVLFLWE